MFIKCTEPGGSVLLFGWSRKHVCHLQSTAFRGSTFSRLAAKHLATILVSLQKNIGFYNQI